MSTKEANRYSSLFESVRPEGYTARHGEYLPAVPLADIKAALHQPRTRFPQATLESFAEELKRDGIQQAIQVRPLPSHYEDGSYPGFEIIAGERRFRAAEMAGLEAVPVVVREVDDDTRYELALIENTQREGLNIADECLALAELKRRKGHNTRELARITGLSTSQVEQRLAASRATGALLDVLASVPNSLVKVANVVRRVPEAEWGPFVRRMRSGGPQGTEEAINELLDKMYPSKQSQKKAELGRATLVQIPATSHPAPVETQGVGMKPGVTLSRSEYRENTEGDSARSEEEDAPEDTPVDAAQALSTPGAQATVASTKPSSEAWAVANDKYLQTTGQGAEVVLSREERVRPQVLELLEEVRGAKASELAPLYADIIDLLAPWKGWKD